VGPLADVEYWHIGETMMRFFRVEARIVRGRKSVGVVVVVEGLPSGWGMTVPGLTACAGVKYERFGTGGLRFNGWFEFVGRGSSGWDPNCGFGDMVGVGFGYVSDMLK